MHLSFLLLMLLLFGERIERDASDIVIVSNPLRLIRFCNELFVCDEIFLCLGFVFEKNPKQFERQKIVLV